MKKEGLIKRLEKDSKVLLRSYPDVFPIKYSVESIDIEEADEKYRVIELPGRNILYPARFRDFGCDEERIC